jgi:uncharacterized cofD-like protein
MKSVVTIGGGTGQFTLLSGLKKFPVHLTAIVSMADDGGSTGVLRDELGVLPPGDVRQCLIALSESDVLLRDLFNYRFDQGGISGHNFGNLFLSALEKITGSFEEAVRVASLVLAIRGEVIPVTTKKITLVCGNGEKTRRGEHIIDGHYPVARETLRLEPEAYANPKAVTAIESADCIVIGPGDLYTSIIPDLLVKGIASAINRAKAPVVMNCNLMNKPGHTDGFKVKNYADEIENFIGRGRINYATCNSNQPSDDLVARYNLEGRVPVPPPENEDIKNSTFKYLPADLISNQPVVKKSGDLLPRTLVRHDADVLAELIIQNCLGGI